MIKSLKNNPILAYQMSNTAGASPRTAGLIAVGLTVIGLALTITGIVTYPDDLGFSLTLFVSALIWDVEMPLLIFGPLLVAGAAVEGTTRAIASDKYRLIRLSPLSEWEIVNGYFACTVFRLRLLWVFAGGLLLPSIVAFAHAGLWVKSISSCPPSANYDCFHPIPQELVPDLARDLVRDSANYMLSYAALFIVWNWLAAALGLWMAFRFRRKGVGFAVTLPVVFLMIASSIVIDFDLIRLRVDETPALLGIAIVSIVLGLAAYLLTVRYVRKTTK